MSSPHIINKLIQEGLLQNTNIETEKLTGGVSSDIYLVSDGINKYVVKEALPKLRVEDEWYADTSRNEIEQKFIQYVQQFLPESIPDIIYTHPGERFFVMEYLDSSFKNWKKQLLQGTFKNNTARSAARLLATIHTKSSQNKKFKEIFNTTANFQRLRIDPYLITTGNRHPELKDLFHKEALRLENQRESLVHGDFSPKNILVKADQVVLLDHEVAWFGDPAFDIAFLLNHLYLKRLFHANRVSQLPDLTRVVWDAYFDENGKNKNKKMDERIGRLLLMLMLARIDGKSPVEYLDKPRKKFVRQFVYHLLPNEIFNQQAINSTWNSKLKKFPRED